MKWLFYVIVFVYMCYRAVYGAEKSDLEVLPISYPDGLSYLPSGSRFTVTCKLSSKNQKVIWLDPKKEEIGHDTTNRVYSHRRIAPSNIKGSPFLLTFTHAMVDDSGVYTCESDGHDDDVTLCVIDAARFVDTSKDVVIDEGRSYTLSCQARGDPQPELIWSKDGQELDADDKLSSKYKIFQKFNHDGYESLLTITSVAPEDGGEYTCTAVQVNVLVDDCALVDHLNITLQVNHKPMFENAGEPTFVFADYNETVNLDCFASAYPKAAYRWFHYESDGTLSEYTAKKIKLLEDATVARLTMLADDDSFGQKFTCTASNDLGESHQDFLLAIIEKPEAPVEVRVGRQYTEFANWDSKAVNARPFVVSVEVLEDELVFNFTFNKGNPPFDVIQAQYKKSDDLDRRPRETEWRRGSRTANLDVLEDSTDQYKLAKLEPNTSYWIRFRTKNEKGYSSWSEPHSVSTRDEETSTELNNEETTFAPAAENATSTQSLSDGTFYGIFFAGGIFVLAFICMFAMRMV